MFNVSSSQFNYLYGDQIHFPYSIGRLVTYAKTNLEINSTFNFLPTYIFRDELENYVLKCKNSDILLSSCYVWNWEITLELAKKVKQVNPNCLIIFGGPQVPNRSNDFFEKYPFVDILVHGEGEIVLENILLEFKNEPILYKYPSLLSPNWGVCGISLAQKTKSTTIRTAHSQR